MSRPRQLLPAEIRLQQSRERLRLWLTHGGDADDEGDEDEGSPHDFPEQIRAWFHDLREHPMLSSTADAVQAWWQSHPWRPATHLAGSLVREAIQPFARKHPIGLVLIAAAVGGSLVWFRPGRGLVKALLLKGVVSQSVLGLARQPFVGALANQFITWMHQVSAPTRKRPAP